MSLLDDLPHRCTIQVRTTSKSALGGTQQTETDVSTDNECWEQPASDSEILEYSKRGIVITHKVYFKADPSVTERNVIKITSRDRGVTSITSPTVLEVRSRAAPDATAGMGFLYRIMVQQRTGDD